jgi:hypothetical protein
MPEVSALSERGLACAEVERLLALEVALSDELQAKTTELAAGRKRAAEAVVDGAASEPSAALGELRDRIELLPFVLDETRRKRRSAILRVWKVEAEGLQAEVAQLRQKAETHLRKTAALLQELREHEQTSFVMERNARLAVIRASGVYPDLAVQAMLPGESVSEKMSAEIGQREHRVRELLKRQPVESGLIEVSGQVPDLIAAVTRDPFVIGPPLPSLRQWAEEGVRRERERRKGISDRWGPRAVSFIPVDAPVPFRLVWQRGELVAGECGAGVEES